MKILNHTYLSIILAAVAMVMAACSSDDANNGDTSLPADGKAKVTLRIATGMEDTVTRTWEDTNAKKTDRSEMMYNWTVIVTDGSAIKYKYSGTPDEAKAEIDNVCTDVEMTADTYTVYSFANISEASLQTILGVADLNAGTALTDATVAAATATIKGNGYAPTADNANGFGSKGIPMSNKQTLTVPASGSVSKDLIVVRMLAKMELQITNSTGADITVKKITLTDVTDNTANNLKLLPYYTNTTGGGADVMENVPGDIKPNLGTPTTTNFVVLSSDLSISNGSKEPVTFYVNESATPTNSDHLFQLLIELDGGEFRYSLISDDASNHWNYIARNDYRIIPITLDDYHFQLVPYDFPPIGVYPVSVKELNATENLYEFTFHDYGHFHLLPQVTKGSSTQVKYNLGSGDYWTLSNDWANSWFTAAAKGGTWLDAAGITAKGFYRSGAGSTTADGDDEGQAPVWYLNDGTAGPQWDPAASANYQPFIFGYIADPGSTMSEDKKIYHEMKIRLYVGGSYRRDMIFRCYMTLSKDQMLYTPRRDATPRRSHHWAQE